MIGYSPRTRYLNLVASLSKMKKLDTGNLGYRQNQRELEIDMKSIVKGKSSKLERDSEEKSAWKAK